MSRFKPATIRAYTASQNSYKEFCLTSDRRHDDADTILEFIFRRAYSGASSSSICRDVAAIRAIFADRLINPVDDQRICWTVRAIKASKPKPRSKKPITPEMQASIMMLFSGKKLTGKEMRDRVVVSLFWDRGFKRSKIKTIKVEDLAKTQLRDDTKAFLNEWCSHARIESGYVILKMEKGGRIFNNPLKSDQQINKIVKEYIKLAGYDPTEFSTHSYRKGSCRRRIDKCEHVADVIDISDHRSYDGLARCSGIMRKKK